MSIESVSLPENAVLASYTCTPGCFTDCYVTQVDYDVSLAAYVEAFYTTWLFRLERYVLARFAKRPSTDEQAHAVGIGLANEFAAWTVETRADDQILMCDMVGRTRSWFMIVKRPKGTLLYFGSAIVPTIRKDGSLTLGLGFSALLGFHKVYSRALLATARARLRTV